MRAGDHMTNQQKMPSGAFNKEHAAEYDIRWKPLASITDTLHLFSRSALNTLPDDAHILCAGVGTGADILAFAETYPGWRFTGFDPSEAMLDVCKKRMDDAGLAGRYTLHQGYIEDLPPSEPFDGAVSFLVSHFITEEKERSGFYRAIADRLKPGALYLNADLAADFNDASFDDLMKIWLSTIAIAGMGTEGQANYRKMFGRDVAAHTPQQVEAMIAASGFTKPVRFYQAALICAWLAHKPKPNRRFWRQP